MANVLLLKDKNLIRKHQAFRSNIIIEYLHFQLSCSSHSHVYEYYCHSHEADQGPEAQIHKGTSPESHSYFKWLRVDPQNQYPDRGGVNPPLEDWLQG